MCVCKCKAVAFHWIPWSLATFALDDVSNSYALSSTTFQRTDSAWGYVLPVRRKTLRGRIAILPGKDRANPKRTASEHQNIPPHPPDLESRLPRGHRASALQKTRLKEPAPRTADEEGLPSACTLCIPTQRPRTTQIQACSPVCNTCAACLMCTMADVNSEVQNLAVKNT